VRDLTPEEAALHGLPELRHGPPWVMEDMIAAQPSIPAPLHGQGDLAALGSAVARAVAAGRLVTVTGCGTSEHAAHAVTELLNEAVEPSPIGRPAVIARQALEAALDPWGEQVCIGVSHEGGTGATIAAMKAARENGALTGLITANPDGLAVAEADHVIQTPVRDESYCHTIGYISPVVAGCFLAARARGADLEPAVVSDCLRAALQQGDIAARVAASLNGAKRVITVGSGLDRVSARELALKIEEGARTPAGAIELETLLHGHLASCDSATAVVLIVTDPRALRARTERAKRLLGAANRLGVRTAAILSPMAASELGELATAGFVETPEADLPSPVLAGLLGVAVALQLLTVGLVHEAGNSPDLIRREQAPYREAAAMVESNWP
jgi:glucosamine--fructose-6-phosphate aminotransferase (isomerizing)